MALRRRPSAKRRLAAKKMTSRSAGRVGVAVGLDREATLKLFRCVIGNHRGLSHAALDLARVALKNDRQLQQFERTIRGAERGLREELLANLRNLGIADPSVGADELRHMR
jgi:hypothetical protein